MARSKKTPTARSYEAFTAIFHCKGTPMRHKCDRRAKQHENDWRYEDIEDDDESYVEE